MLADGIIFIPSFVKMASSFISVYININIIVFSCLLYFLLGKESGLAER